jgi:hypothetical protein
MTEIIWAVLPYSIYILAGVAILVAWWNILRHGASWRDLPRWARRKP